MATYLLHLVAAEAISVCEATAYAHSMVLTIPEWSHAAITHVGLRIAGNVKGFCSVVHVLLGEVQVGAGGTHFEGSCLSLLRNPS